MLPRQPTLRAKKDNLPESVVREIKDTFDLFDYNKNSKVETKELRSLMVELGFDPKDEEIKKITAANKNGMIGYWDFLEIMTVKVGQRNPVKETRKAFRQFLDQETDAVDVTHLNKIAKEIGAGMSEQQFRDLITRVEQGTEDDLDEETFIAILKKTSLW
jgi:centrin-1